MAFSGTVFCQNPQPKSLFTSLDTASANQEARMEWTVYSHNRVTPRTKKRRCDIPKQSNIVPNIKITFPSRWKSNFNVALIEEEMKRRFTSNIKTFFRTLKHLRPFYEVIHEHSFNDDSSTLKICCCVNVLMPVYSCLKGAYTRSLKL